MKFALYLKRKGVITAEQLVAALEEQHERLAPLGQLAMEEGILSARSVFRVLRCQTDLPHERFGELAVEMGLLTPAQLDYLLALQASRKPPLLDILIRQHALSAVQANEELAAYRHDMERRNVVVTRRIANRPHQPRAAASTSRDDATQYATKT